MTTDNPQNGEVATCQTCGELIEYYHGWKHRHGEHQRPPGDFAWPKRDKPESEDNAQPAPEGSPVVWWGY